MVIRKGITSNLYYLCKQESTHRNMNKKNIPIALFFLMIFGLLCSRAILSITEGCWFVYALVQIHTWKKKIVNEPLLIWSLCPVFLFFLGVWQQPFQISNYDYLLTLLAYPVAAFSIVSWQNEPSRKIINRIWFAATISGILYSLFYFFQNSHSLLEGLGKGQSLPTLMDEDHIRFAIFLCAGLTLLLFSNSVNPFAKPFLVLGILGFLFFLSVRTAWVMAMVILLVYILGQYQNSRQKKPIRLLIIGCLMGAGIGLAYLVFPSIQQKIAYSVYDWQQIRQGGYHPNYSDGTRWAVNQAAWQAIQDHRGSNLGWAGITDSLPVYFAKIYPGNSPDFRWPFNQYLFWWMGAGWWGMLLFTAWLFYPVIWGIRKRKDAVTAWSLAMAISCLVESNLAFQFGVWLHAWPLALLWFAEEKKSAISGSGNS